MRTLFLLGMLLLGCGSLGKPCTADSSCTGEEVCSTTAGGTCTLRCDTKEFCVSAFGQRSACGKYIGPDSSGYACAPR